MFGKFITTTATNGVTLATTALEYYSKDNLGSIVAITDGAGIVTQRLSYDVWGKRRYPNGAADPNGLLNNPDMYHGFTGHEMLDSVGLIHMNGRLYDPVMARFVSADFLIQSPDNLQSYNRYAYGWNNPLAGTDPSGQIFGIDDFFYVLAAVTAARATNVIDTKTARGIIGIAAGVLLGPAGGLAGTFGGGLGGAMITGGIVGGISSGWNGVAGGAFSAGLFYGAGFVGGELDFSRIAAHAAAGCISASASGGDCGSGAVSAGFAQFAGPRMPNLGDFGNTIVHAVLGGTASILGGGKFQNGAMNGAFGYLFNALQPEHADCMMMCHEVKYNPGQQMPEADQQAIALEVLGTAATVMAAPEVVAGRIVGVVKELKYAESIRLKAVKDPTGHGFPYSFDAEILKTKPIIQSDKTLFYVKPGYINDQARYFTIVVRPDNGTIIHRAMQKSYKIR